MHGVARAPEGRTEAGLPPNRVCMNRTRGTFRETRAVPLRPPPTSAGARSRRPSSRNGSSSEHVINAPATPVSSALRAGAASQAPVPRRHSAATSAAWRGRRIPGSPRTRPSTASAGRRAPVGAAAGTQSAGPNRRRSAGPARPPTRLRHCCLQLPGGSGRRRARAALPAAHTSADDHVVESGRVRVFRRQPVIDGNHRAAPTPRELDTLAVIGVEITQDKRSSMAVDDSGCGRPAAAVDPYRNRVCAFSFDLIIDHIDARRVDRGRGFAAAIVQGFAEHAE